MAHGSRPTALLVVGGLLLGTLTAPAAAVASGEIGPHVQEFQRHLDEYEAEVRELDEELDALAERYARGEASGDDVDAFVQSWESVKYHGAVETVATPLYPPIWQGISGLRQAIEGDEPPAVVRRRADELTAALDQGLGALKLKATMTDDGPSTQTPAEPAPEGPAAAFDLIGERLDQAVQQYADGHPEAAKQRIHDAYFNAFEGLEGGLIEQDPELVARLEEAFNAELPGLIDEGAAVERVRAKVQEMKQRLDRSETLLERSDGGDHGEVF